ncbi:helix-turn-helix domain-containing protein [Thomasclavelia cocleata]|uniref:helix-turn-helix domain-containing protein n=1 Tax=Thomasclavelia cocleata TaxID=69824 RepID=UPI00242C45AC|nr:helix-turn-helix transcriptional regulator [Thomasclavelia cocleata]
MNTIENRIKLLRKTLGLSMEKFGEKIGLSKTTISRVESGDSPLTQKNIKLICSIYNVDYFWLTEGTGEMFLEFPDVAIDMIVEDYKLDEIDRLLVQTYIETNDEDRKVIKNFLQTFAKKIEQKKDEKT